MAERRPARPIRVRVTVAATSVALLALVVAAGGLVWSQRLVLTARIDRQLEDRSDLLRTGLATGTFGPGTGRFQVIDPDGVLVASSPGFSIPIPANDIEATTLVRSIDGIPEADDRSRVLSRLVETPEGVFVIHTAEPMDAIDEAATALTASLALAIPLVTGLLGWLIWSMVGRTLRPVEAIRAEVAKISLSDLSRRVPEAGDDEVGRLGRTMNEMLAALEKSTARQRRFVADASHELRTPLTRMRSELEVDVAHPAGADPAATARSLLEEVERLQRLVDDLLSLARTESTAVMATMVDLTSLVTEEVAASFGRGRIEIDAEPGFVMGNSLQLRLVVRNLVDNARRHAAGLVGVTVRRDGSELVLAVTDDGAGIEPEERLAVFDPFYRLDEARTAADGGGTGLGLAIVREIVASHSGSVFVDPDHAPGTRFVVKLPAASS